MTKMRTVDIVKNLAIPIIDKNNFELVDIEFVKEGSQWFLRIYIDKEGGITLEDCQIVSEYISKKLDEADPIKQNYYLEVSSPGIDRPLRSEKDFEKYKGRIIEVHLYEAIEKQKCLEGELLGLKDDHIVLKTSENEVIELPRNKASKVNLAVII